MGYVKLVGTTDPHTNWTAEYILERDDDGTPTKVVSLNVPVDLTKDEQEQLEGQGAVFEKSSADEAKEAEQDDTPEVGTDVAASGPRFGAGTRPGAQDNDDNE